MRRFWSCTPLMAMNLAKTLLCLPTGWLKKKDEKMKVRGVPTFFFFSLEIENTPCLSQKIFHRCTNIIALFVAAYIDPGRWLAFCIYNTWPFSASFHSKYGDSALDIHTTLTLRGTTNTVFVLDINKRTSWLQSDHFSWNIAIQGEPATLCSQSHGQLFATKGPIAVSWTLPLLVSVCVPVLQWS